MTWFEPAIRDVTLVIAVLFRFFSAHAVSAGTKLVVFFVSHETDPDATTAIVVCAALHRTARDSMMLIASSTSPSILYVRSFTQIS